MASADTDDPTPNRAGAGHSNDDDDEQQRLEQELERLLQAQEEEESEVDLVPHPPEEHHDPVHHDGQRLPAADFNEGLIEQEDIPPLEPPLQGDRALPMPPVPNNHNATAPTKTMSFLRSALFFASTLFYYVMRTRQQFYLAMVYLTSSKISLAVFGHAFIAVSISCFDMVVNLFLDGMRLQEAEGLQDFFRWNVTETCLGLTMFRSELTVQTAVEFLLLIWIKCIHQVTMLRANHVRMTQESVVPTNVPLIGTVPLIPWTHLKLWMLLIALQLLDLWVVQYTALSVLQDGPSLNLLFVFESAILLVSAWSHLLLLYLHVVDGLLHYGHENQLPIVSKFLHPWKEYKATIVFAVELQRQAIQFFFYFAFFGTVMNYYGMPINLLREVYMSFAALNERLTAFFKYRHLMANMNRFQNATDEQLEESGRTCIICRDEMTPHDSKQLPVCCHVFHKSCLREWLVQQQSCPTCRSDIAAMSAQEATRNAAARAANQRHLEPNVPQQQQQAETEEPAPTDHWNPDAEIEGAEVAAAVHQPPSQSVRSAAPSFKTNDERQPLLDRQSGGLRSPSAMNRLEEDPLFSLFRVVRKEGTAVWLDGRLLRVIPEGTVIVSQACVFSNQGVLLRRIPDGWIPDHDVIHVKSVMAWETTPAAAATAAT